MKNTFLLSIIMLCFSCEEVEFTVGDQKEDDIFVIKEGSHKSIYAYKKLDSHILDFQAMFNESAIYTTEAEDNQADINKLMGFTDCGSHHHQNSARFGWRWFNDELQILAYVYEDGARRMKLITPVPLNELIDYQIEKRETGYFFKVGNKTYEMSYNDAYCISDNNELLWPYFGGQESAPHDIEIYIKQIQ